MPETVIIVRTKNEERWLGKVLETLFNQTYKNFEIIIVDSGSSDRTLEIARKFPVKIFTIPPEKFSYPYALNFGIEHSSAADYIVIISAHSLPVSRTWLADGLRNFAGCKKVAGVFAFPLALPDATFWDKFFQNSKIMPRHFRRIFTRPVAGILGFTNSVIKKELWEQRKFNEAYGAGGEDQEWASFWLSQGYLIIQDEKFRVRHSHYLGLGGWFKQWRYWRSLGEPSSFQSLEFRRKK